MNKEVAAYNAALAEEEQAICNLLATEIHAQLPEAENKIWHRHPVWFLDGNPVAGYSKLKGGIRLMFWSGQSFTARGLDADGSFKAASITYTFLAQVDTSVLHQWLQQARDIQWDYKNIVKRKGKLERLR